MSQKADNRVSPEVTSELASSSTGSMGLRVQHILSLEQCRALTPVDMTRLFFHSVREGNTEQVSLLLKCNSALISQLDDQLMGALHYAVKCDRVAMVTMLLHAGANVNQKGREGARPLHVAVNLNRPEALQELLQSRKVRVDATDDRGQTALHVACKRNNEEAVKILLTHKASLQLKENDGTSVLHLPSRRNNLQLCQILTSDTALVACRDKHGVTPLMVAASDSGEELLNHFVSVCKMSGTDVTQLINAQDSEGNTAVHYAVKSNKVSVLESLRDCGANFNLQNVELATPLHLAATLGHKESASKLLEFGIKPNQPDKLGRTPLHCCIISRQSEVCDILLAAGAIPRLVDAEFMTPFHWACRRGLVDVAKKLAVADPGCIAMADIYMRTGMHWAVLASSTELVQLLLSLPTGMEALCASDFHDKYPMHYAAEMKNTEIVKLLISQGADFHLVDTMGRTPTQLAVQIGDADLVRLICDQKDSLKRQALRHRDLRGNTSLLIAAEQGHTEVFNFLLSRGADFTIKDEFGRTALMMSVSNGHFDISSTLIDKGIDINASDTNRNTALHYASKFLGTNANCLELLLSNGAHLQQNYNGETPVDVAVLNNNGPAISLYFSDTYCKWVMGFRRDNGMTHLDILIQHSPQTAMSILNLSMTESSTDRLDKNFMVAYDFFHLDPGPDDPSSAQQRYLALRTMVKKKRMELLQHPLSQGLLECKWSIARYFFWCDFLVYMVLLCCITAFVVDNGPLKPTEMDASTGCKNTSSSGSYTGQQQKLTDATLILEKSIVTGILAIRVFLEVIKLIFKRLQYLKNVENMFFLILYIFTFVFVYPPDSEPCMYNWVCGLFSVIMVWSLLIFQFEHLPVTGIYSLMFQKVILSLVKVLAIFTFFIIGFAFAFNIGFISQTAFHYPAYSILKTFDMTVGELDFVTYFINGITNQDMQYGMLVVFVIFVIIMPIGLMNLLVGIAVGDIDGISKEAELRLIEIRINLIYELETNLPRYFQRRMLKRFLQVYPNRIGNRVSEYIWPCGSQYRAWLQKCADDRAEITSEERLESVEASVNQLTEWLAEIHKAVVRH